MKNSIKLLLLCLSVTILGISKLPVLAAEPNIMPRAEVCGNCDNGVLFTRTYVEEETNWETCPSIEIPGYNDLFRYKVTYSALICSNCGAKAQIKEIGREFVMRHCSHGL